MKAVALKTLLPEFARQRNQFSHWRLATMKARVEASYLRNTRQALNSRFNSSEVVGLMKWRERDQFAQIFEHLLVDDSWTFKLRAAMHDAMAHAKHSRSGILRTKPDCKSFHRFVPVSDFDVLFRETPIGCVFNR